MDKLSWILSQKSVVNQNIGKHFYNKIYIRKFKNMGYENKVQSNFFCFKLIVLYFKKFIWILLLNFCYYNNILNDNSIC